MSGLYRSHYTLLYAGNVFVYFSYRLLVCHICNYFYIHVIFIHVPMFSAKNTIKALITMISLNPSGFPQSVYVRVCVSVRT